MGICASEFTTASGFQVEKDPSPRRTHALDDYHTRTYHILGDAAVVWGEDDGEGIFGYVVGLFSGIGMQCDELTVGYA